MHAVEVVPEQYIWTAGNHRRTQKVTVQRGKQLRLAKQGISCIWYIWILRPHSDSGIDGASFMDCSHVGHVLL